MGQVEGVLEARGRWLGPVRFGTPVKPVQSLRFHWSRTDRQVLAEMEEAARDQRRVHALEDKRA